MKQVPRYIMESGVIGGEEIISTGPEASQPASMELTPDRDMSIERLLDRVRPRDRDMIQRAFDVASKQHDDQFRKSGEPYIHHPLVVAHYLADLNMDGPSITAGLLHDVLEDTKMSKEALGELFPEPVPKLVGSVTKISKIKFSSNRQATVENLRILILAMARDIRVTIIKLCDRLHNMQTLQYLGEEKRRRIAQETMDVYAPLANRLGISRMKSQLEDLCFRWLYPDDYAELQRLLEESQEERNARVQYLVGFLSAYVNSDRPEGKPPYEVSGRSKHLWSVFRKMRDTGVPYQQIYDLNALRVICDTVDECYTLQGKICTLWAYDGRLTKVKDYIAMPKKNGYESIHIIFERGFEGRRTEIQIRTRAMHDEAEYGVAAHWKYKESNKDVRLDDKIRFLRHLMESITDAKEPEDLVDRLHSDVFADVRMVFTPAGDLIELPAGATPIDFAYAIHTKVGEHCSGAKVGGRIVPLSTRLENGQIVEVLTSPQAHPSRDWLRLAVTSRARQKIKHWLKTQEAAEWADVGRRALIRHLRERTIRLAQGELETYLEKLRASYGMSTVEDVLVEIGFGSISAHAALERMNPDWVRKQKPRKQRKEKRAASSESPVIVDGLDGMEPRLGNCCRPIPGDPIVGFITRGRGITVHHSNCRMIRRALLESGEERNRILSAHWNSSESVRHVLGLSLEARDRHALLKDVMDVMDKYSVFILGCNTESDESRKIARQHFRVQVANPEDLPRLMKELEGVTGVYWVGRTRK